MHSNGAILGYKVVRIHIQGLSISFEIFSSDTGEWSVTQVTCPGPFDGFLLLNTSNPVSLNGKLHWLGNSDHIIVHDLFSRADDQVRAISLPDKLQSDPYTCESTCRKMICTTSQGDFVLIDAELIKEVNSYHVRVWTLKSDPWSWEKNMACVGLGRRCVPMAINCFDIDVIYLWDLDRRCFIACNLRTLAKSYGARKVATQIDSTFQNPFDTLCFEPRSLIEHFVPSLQVLPTYRNPR